MRRTETPKPIWIKFCVVVDIPDLVTYTNFGDHWLMGFWVAGGQISPSTIDIHRRPYNTLALPCERVMTSLHHWMLWSVTSSITYLDSVRDDFYNCSSGDSSSGYTVYFEFLN